MLPVNVRRVILAQHRVDFRKGPDGLLGEAYRLGADPYSGDCVLFVKRDHTQLRASPEGAGPDRVFRGGSFTDGPCSAASYVRRHISPSGARVTTGHRCASDD